jgi:hypothetical protein
MLRGYEEKKYEHEVVLNRLDKLSKIVEYLNGIKQDYRPENDYST